MLYLAKMKQLAAQAAKRLKGRLVLLGVPLYAIELVRSTADGGSCIVCPLPKVETPMFRDEKMTPEGEKWLRSFHVSLVPLAEYYLASGVHVVHGIEVRNGLDSLTTSVKDFAHVDFVDARKKDKAQTFWIATVHLSHLHGIREGDLGPTIDFYLEEFFGGGKKARDKLLYLAHLISSRRSHMPTVNPDVLVEEARKDAHLE